MGALILLVVPPLGVYNQNTEGENCEFQARHNNISQTSSMYYQFTINSTIKNKKALTNPRDAKACQNCSNSTCLQRCSGLASFVWLLLPSKICEILQNSLKIQTYRVQGHLGANRKLTCDLLLVTNSNFGRICYRFRDTVHSAYVHRHRTAKALCT